MGTMTAPEFDEHLKKVELCREAIEKHIGGKWKKGDPPHAGEIICPVCGGSRGFVRAGVNGHISSACNTPGCVDWRE